MFRTGLRLVNVRTIPPHNFVIRQSIYPYSHLCSKKVSRIFNHPKSTVNIQKSFSIEKKNLRRSFFTAKSSKKEHFSVEVKKSSANEKNITFSTGEIGRLADGCVSVSCGEKTMLLATVVTTRELNDESQDFMLQVEYRDKAFAIGRIPRSHNRREGRESREEILKARMLDRAIRPLFPNGFYYETQVTSTILSSDNEIQCDVLSIVGASAALMVSDIPWDGPIGAARVGYINKKFVLNPTKTQMKSSDLNLVYAATEDNVLMIEADANQLSNEKFQEAILYAHENVQNMIKAQYELSEKCGKKKRKVECVVVPPDVLGKAKSIFLDDINKIYLSQKSNQDKTIELNKIKIRMKNELKSHFQEISDVIISKCFIELEMNVVRSLILDKNRRCDGRILAQIRPVFCSTNVLPAVHGSAIFERGETQVVSTATLASEELSTYLSITGEELERQLVLDYEFPPYCTNEIGRLMPGRREEGHGALAEKSLLAVLPNREEYPYSIRVSCVTTQSNGSSSMASVCGSSMALLDAGVPLTAAVAGISIGLVTRKDENNKILKFRLVTDLLGCEDFLGDMDFKIAGTRLGLTGIQLDIKLAGGIPLHIVKRSLKRAKNAHIKLLDLMEAEIKGPRVLLKDSIPRCYTYEIEEFQLGILRRGTTIDQIQEETGCEVMTRGTKVFFQAPTDKSLEQARGMVEGVISEWRINEDYDVVVSRILDVGIIVKYNSLREGFVHIDELSHSHHKHPDELGIDVGNTIRVRCVGYAASGRYTLSRKALIPVLPGEGAQAIKIHPLPENVRPHLDPSKHDNPYTPDTPIEDENHTLYQALPNNKKNRQTKSGKQSSKIKKMRRKKLQNTKLVDTSSKSTALKKTSESVWDSIITQLPVGTASKNTAVQKKKDRYWKTRSQ